MATLLTQKVKFETLAVILIVYVAILTRQIEPNYYQGMKILAKELRYIPNKIVFTKPADYIIGKYYMYNLQNQVVLFDPENPDLDYSWWPFITKEAKLKAETATSDLSNTPVFVIPRNGFVPAEFESISFEGEYGDYNLYVKTN